MHDWVSFNSHIIKSSDAEISALSGAALYGKGVFTTIAIRGGLPFLFEKHWLRLESNAAFLGIPLRGLTKEALFASLIELIDRNSVDDGRCRTTIFDGSPSRRWNHPGPANSPVLIQTADAPEIENRLTMGHSPFKITSNSEFNRVKSCNYLERLHAFETASRQGFHEAVRLNENGEVVSACMANLFWITDGRIFTPSVETGCLAGTSREYVIERCSVSETRLGIEALRNAQTVFLTSAGFGLKSVFEIVFEGETRKFEPIDEMFLDENGLSKLSF